LLEGEAAAAFVLLRRIEPIGRPLGSAGFVRRSRSVSGGRSRWASAAASRETKPPPRINKVKDGCVTVVPKKNVARTWTGHVVQPEVAQ
jgi:hypothetical protein